MPAPILNAQLKGRDQAAQEIAAEGFDAVLAPEPVEIVPSEMVAGAEAQGTRLRFGLQLSSFAGGQDAVSFADRIAEAAALAEAVGFTSLWVMDHMIQIPQVGRRWEDLPESWTTLAWLAGRTRTIRLGTLVTGVTLRNPAHLAKIVATLDVLSGGRVICGLGLAWWEWEHRLYGWPFPPTARALRPARRHPATPAGHVGSRIATVRGRVLQVPETLCYPRPLQDHVPILVGGSGEKTTLRLAARHANACNLFGNPETVARKRAILERHCADAGRDPAEVRVTHLSTAIVAESRRQVTAAVRTAPAGRVSTRAGCGSVGGGNGRRPDRAVQPPGPSRRRDGHRRLARHFYPRRPGSLRSGDRQFRRAPALETVVTGPYSGGNS